MWLLYFFMHYTNGCWTHLDFWLVSLEQHLTLLMSLVEDSTQHSLINTTGHLSAYICTASEEAARQHMACKNTQLIAQVDEQGKSWTLYRFINMYRSLCPYVCLAQWETEFWRCPFSLLACEHLRDEMHPDTQGWFPPPLSPAGGRHDLITRENE